MCEFPLILLDFWLFCFIINDAHPRMVMAATQFLGFSLFFNFTNEKCIHFPLQIEMVPYILSQILGSFCVSTSKGSRSNHHRRLKQVRFSIVYSGFSARSGSLLFLDSLRFLTEEGTQRYQVGMAVTSVSLGMYPLTLKEPCAWAWEIYGWSQHIYFFNYIFLSVNDFSVATEKWCYECNDYTIQISLLELYVLVFN